MPQRDQAPVGAPCWIELFTSEPDRILPFYRQLFGWTDEAAGEEFGGYINLSKDGQRVAGCMKNDDQSGTPDLWTVYLATDDVKAVADTAAAQGGQIIVPPMPVMDLGAMAVLLDPGQAAVGAWQPGSHAGFQVLAEPGTPSWFELHTRDYDACVRFYQDVFGWTTHTMSDASEFRYTTLGEGETALAGIMDGGLPDGAPAHWAIYFGVEDTDAALTKVFDLGGEVVSGPDDTPYGRLAEVADPTGAHFRLIA